MLLASKRQDNSNKGNGNNSSSNNKDERLISWWAKVWEIHLIFLAIARLVISTVGISRTIKTVRKLCTVGIYWSDPIIPVQLPQSFEWFPPRHHDNKDNNKRSHLGEESWTKGRRGCPISRCRVWTVLFWIVDNPWRGKRHWQVGIES